MKINNKFINILILFLKLIERLVCGMATSYFYNNMFEKTATKYAENKDVVGLFWLKVFSNYPRKISGD